jgi:hypothetical protein
MKCVITHLLGRHGNGAAVRIPSRGPSGTGQTNGRTGEHKEDVDGKSRRWARPFHGLNGR